MNSIVSFLDRARSAAKAARFVEARHLARLHILEEPQSFKAWGIVGTLAVKANDLDHAVIFFRRASQSAKSYDPRIAMNLGRALSLSQQVLRAQDAYEAVLARAPKHYPAHFELARLHLEAARVDQAAPHLIALAALAPVDWPHLEAMRRQLTTLEHWSAAVPFVATLAARRGDDPGLWSQLFKLAIRSGHANVAAASLRRVLLLHPCATALWRDFATPHLVQGAKSEMLNLFQAGVSSSSVDEVGLLRWAYYFRSHDALSGVAMVLGLADRLALHHPRFAPFRAWMIVESGQLPDLGALVTAFTRAGHDDIVAWNDLGLVIRSVKDRGETCKFYRLAHRQFPDHLTLQHNLAQAEVDNGNLAIGQRLARQIVVQDPCAFRSLNLLGILEGEYDAPQIAVKIFRRCLVIDPNWPPGFLNLGLQLSSCGDRRGAIDTMRTALASSDGEYPQAAYNLALELIGNGEIAEGFHHYRMRWRADGFLSQPRPLPQTEWPGPSAAPRSNLALYMEQGMGDEVMYSWYLPWVAADARSLTVECDSRLMPIFRRSFPNIIFVPREEPLNAILSAPEIDHQSAIASVPEFYATALSDVIREQQASPEVWGRRHRPRLAVNPRRLAYWREYLNATFADRPRFGVVWRSALRDHKRDKQYVTPSQLTAALPPGVGLVNLQYSYEAEEVATFSTLGARHDFQFETPPGIDLKDDLDDLFALIQCLDGVVGPLISVPWMAAAVGTPAFVIRTEAKGYIWQQLNTPHVPWAPSMRLFFRSPTAPWETVLETVKQALIREFFSPT